MRASEPSDLPWMSLAYLTWFVPACLAISIAPGPSNVLSLSHASRQGFAAAWLAGCGRLAAFACMGLLVAAGLVATLHASPALFQLAQVVGMALLLYWILRAWRGRQAQGTDAGSPAPDAGLLRMARNEFMLAAGNPKVFVVLTVLAPRAIDPAKTNALQLATPIALFILAEWFVIAVYAAFGTHTASLLRHPGFRRLLGKLGLRPSR